MEMREKNVRKLRRRAAMLLASAMLCFGLGSSGAGSFGEIPDRLSLTAGSSASLELGLPVSAELRGDGVSMRSDKGSIRISAGGESASASLILRLLGIVPVKTVDVEVNNEKILIPGGDLVGLAIETDGLIVVGMSDLGRISSPARKAGLKPGDVITCVNDVPVSSADTMENLLSPGREARLTVMRGGEERSLALTPALDPRDDAPRIGAWVRSGAAGVGTLTYIDPANGDFGALGHAIADIDTGVTMPVAQGAIYESEIAQVNPGKKGAPGEIVGDFFTAEKQIGELEQNGDSGVFGSGYCGETGQLIYPDGLPMAARSEVRCGEAAILSNVDGQVREYDCVIERIEPDSRQIMRALVVRVTDDELIAKTGGIVQGMSGSPIIQDGKLAGAVTHVFVNDPTRGYGIFIENMLEAAG